MIKIIKSKYKFCSNCNEPASQFFYVIAGYGRGKPLCLSCVTKLGQACTEIVDGETDESSKQMER